MNNFLFLMEAMPEGRILGFDMEFIMEVGVQWINTIVMTLFLAKFLYKPVRKFLANRAERVSEQLLSASNAEQTALSLKSDYENKLDNIEQERTYMLDDARRNAQEKTEYMLAEAQLSAKMLRSRAHEDIKTEQERVKDDLKREVIELATMLAGRFAAVSLDKKAQDRLITESISDLGDIKWLK